METGLASRLHLTSRCEEIRSNYWAFLTGGNTADESMRSVTFTLKERAVLIPLEIFLLKNLIVNGTFF